jgi:hypothetical protein
MPRVVEWRRKDQRGFLPTACLTLSTCSGVLVVLILPPLLLAVEPASSILFTQRLIASTDGTGRFRGTAK